MTDYIKTLPANYTYRLSEFTGDYSDVESTYKAIFHASLRTMDDVTDWINVFSRQTQTNWNVRDTHKELQVLQRKDFVCHMKDYHNRPKKFAKSSIRYKHCDCPATITFKMKQVNRNSCRRYHWVRDGMPTTVFINNNHNHAVISTEALSFRKIDPITRATFNSYFDQGMSPTAAADFHIHQLDLEPEAADDPLSRADAARNPTRSTVSYLYSLWRKSDLGDRQGDGIGACTCSRRMDGRCCEHQVAIYKESMPNIPPGTAASHCEAASLALGDKMLPLQSDQSLLIPTEPSEVSTPLTSPFSSTEASNLSVTQSVDSLEYKSNLLQSQNKEDAIQRVLSMWKDLSVEIESALYKYTNNCDEENLRSGMEKLKQSLSNVHTGSQLCTFFHSFGQMVPRRDCSGSKIPTQPTADAKRKRPGITRGIKTQLGRPALAEKVSVKRRRSLACNVEAGVPNVKSQGH